MPRPCQVRPDVLLARLLAAWPAAPEEFQRLCHAVHDWRSLLDQAERHGVLGVLYAPLTEPATGLPLEARERARERRTVERLWAARLVAALGEALAALTAAGIDALALKGPVLSERLYDDSLARLSSDLDILVRIDDLERAQTALEELGYRTEEGPSARYQRRYHHHLTLTRPQGPTIELHFRVFSGFGITIPAEAAFAGAVRHRTREGVACLVLPPAEELLYLCLHAAGHNFERLAWLYDIKTLLAKHGQPDWPALFARARSYQVERAFSLALAVLCQRLGDVCPGLSATDRATPRRRAAAGLLSWLENQPLGSASDKLGAIVFQAFLCDRVTVSVGYLNHHLGRMARRRLQRYLPALVPAEWSG